MIVLRRFAVPLFAGLSLVIHASPLMAADTPKVMGDLFNCRSIVEAGARLACFDKASALLADAEGQGDVRVIDRQQLAQSRRALFGFTLPTLDLFNDHKASGAKPGGIRNDPDEITEISANIAAVGSNRDGGYILTLEDGARWEQTDLVSLGHTPRHGDVVKIQRGILGSYKLTIGHGPAMKVRRLD